MLFRWKKVFYIKDRFLKKPGLYAILAISVLIIILIIVFTHMAGNQCIKGHPSCIASAVKEQVKEQVKKIIIDPGHGGPDEGATGVGGVLEKNLNLIIADKLKAAFKKEKYTVIMTRDDDRSINDPGCKSLYDKKNSDLNNRIKIESSNPDAIFISLHQNDSDNPQYSGTQVFYSLNNPGSKVLAKDIQSEVKADLQPGNNRAIQEEGKLRVLVKAKIPAVLVECGFISNAAEAHNLEDSSYQKRLVTAIVNATDIYKKTL